MKKILGKEGGREDGWLVWVGHGTYGGEKGAPFCVGYAGGRGDLQPSSWIHRRQVQKILGGVRSKLRRFCFGTRMYLVYNSLHHIPHLHFRLSKCFVPTSLTIHRELSGACSTRFTRGLLINPPCASKPPYRRLCNPQYRSTHISKSTSRYNSSQSMTHPGTKSLIRPRGGRSHGLPRYLTLPCSCNRPAESKMFQPCQRQRTWFT